MPDTHASGALPGGRQAPPELLIVAGAITDSLALPRRLLSARRTLPAWARGQWEFAGGKVERGESVEEALRRELREELGVEVLVGDELVGPHTSAETGDAVWEIREFGSVPAPDVPPSAFRLVMRIFWCEIAPGSAEPAPLEDHDEVTWLEPGAWRDGVNWLRADEPIVAALIDDAIRRHRGAAC